MTSWAHKCFKCFRTWSRWAIEPDKECPFCGHPRVYVVGGKPHGTAA